MEVGGLTNWQKETRTEMGKFCTNWSRAVKMGSADTNVAKDCKRGKVLLQTTRHWSKQREREREQHLIYGFIHCKCWGCATLCHIVHVSGLQETLSLDALPWPCAQENLGQVLSLHTTGRWYDNIMVFACFCMFLPASISCADKLAKERLPFIVFILQPNKIWNRSVFSTISSWLLGTWFLSSPDVVFLWQVN